MEIRPSTSTQSVAAERDSTEKHPSSTRTFNRRAFLRYVAAAVGTTVVSVDIPKTIEAWGQRRRKPSLRANPTSLSRDADVYHGVPQESLEKVITPTMYGSVEEYLRAASRLQNARSIEELRHAAQDTIFSKIGGSVTFGGTNQPEKWEKYATDEATRLSGLPVNMLGGLTTHIGMPDLDTARFAVRRTQVFAAAVPLAIHRAINLTECGFAAGMKITAPLIDHTVDNGASDTVHRATMVDCMEGDTRRKGVGAQWLYQDCMVLDAVISNSPTTFNDPEFASVMPNLVGVDQHRLDFPARDDTEIFGIASLKAERFKEILSGELILPGDDTFYAPQQVQQELLLRRLYGTFSDIPPTYFEGLTRFKRTHGQLPVWGGQLAA